MELCEGENVIAVHTLYQGLINRVWVSGDDRHGLILDIEQDVKTVLSSDESFRLAYHSGVAALDTVGYATQFNERYTSGSPEEGFFLPRYDDSGCDFASENKYVDYELFEQPSKYYTETPMTVADFIDATLADSELDFRNSSYYKVYELYFTMYPVREGVVA